MTTRCDSCHNECEVIEVDQGIGPYEYWGQTGKDVKLVDVSDCCEDRFYEWDGEEDPALLFQLLSKLQGTKVNRSFDNMDDVRRYLK